MKHTFIDEKQIQENQNSELPFGPLGELVDIRTYRRWLPTKIRRETAAERNARVVNYNIGLAVGKQDSYSLQAEADLMYEMLNNLEVWPSGRTAWVGGTTTTELNPAANFNCSFLAINRMGAFCDLFELLMLGTGVGFRVHSKDINKLPRLINFPKITFEKYEPVEKYNRESETTAELSADNKTLYVEIGDCRQGWIDGLSLMFSAYTNEASPHSSLKLLGKNEVPWEEIEHIQYNVNSVRPMGERIKGFGGTASGPQALQGILTDVAGILNEIPRDGSTDITRIRSIDGMDISCAIARGVVAGSSRRSALICLFEEGDELCAKAKKGLYTDTNLAHKAYRSQSNNTENIGASDLNKVKEFLLINPDLDVNHPKVDEFLSEMAPSVADLYPKFESVKTEGEPGFDNWARMVIMRFYAAVKWRNWMSPREIWDNYCDIGTNPSIICEAA